VVQEGRLHILGLSATLGPVGDAQEGSTLEQCGRTATIRVYTPAIRRLPSATT